MKTWVRNKTNDHWWPRALQTYWRDSNDQIFVANRNEIVPRSKSNKKVGARRGGHHVDFGGSPWTHSFEGEFSYIDDKIHYIINWIQGNIYPSTGGGVWLPAWLLRNLPNRPEVKFLPDDLQKDLVELVFSLLVRLPAFRSRRSAQPRSWGLPDDERIGALEINRYYGLARSIIRKNSPSGFCLFFHSKTGDFIYGDGLMDELTESLINLSFFGYCLVPLTPQICLFYTTSIGSPFSRRVACISSDNDITTIINKITLRISNYNVYSSKIENVKTLMDSCSTLSSSDDRLLLEYILRHGFLYNFSG